MNEKGKKLEIKNDEKFFPWVLSESEEKEEKNCERENENIKNWEPFMLNLFFMLGLPEIFFHVAFLSGWS